MLLLMKTLTISLRIMNYDDDNGDKSWDMMYYTTYWRDDDVDHDDDPLPQVFSNRSNTNSRHLQAWQIHQKYPQMLFVFPTPHPFLSAFCMSGVKLTSCCERKLLHAHSQVLDGSRILQKRGRLWIQDFTSTKCEETHRRNALVMTQYDSESLPAMEFWALPAYLRPLPYDCLRLRCSSS